MNANAKKAQEIINGMAKYKPGQEVWCSEFINGKPYVHTELIGENVEIDTDFWEFVYYSDTGMEIGCEDKIFTSPIELILYHIKTLEENIDGIKSNPFECNKHIIKTIQRQIDAWKEAEKEFANYE